jgi:hypothetical protein
MPRSHFTPGKDPVSIVQEAGWASGSVWTGAENLAPTGIRFPDRPARRQSLYRPRYPAHNKLLKTQKQRVRSNAAVFAGINSLFYFCNWEKEQQGT